MPLLVDMTANYSVGRLVARSKVYDRDTNRTSSLSFAQTKPTTNANRRVQNKRCKDKKKSILYKQMQQHEKVITHKHTALV